MRMPSLTAQSHVLYDGCIPNYNWVDESRRHIKKREDYNPFFTKSEKLVVTC